MLNWLLVILDVMSAGGGASVGAGRPLKTLMWIRGDRKQARIKTSTTFTVSTLTSVRTFYRFMVTTAYIWHHRMSHHHIQLQLVWLWDVTLWLIHWMSGWSIGMWLIHWMSNWSIYCLIYLFTVWLIHWIPDWSIECDWYIERSIEHLIHLLIDPLNVCLMSLCILLHMRAAGNPRWVQRNKEDMFPKQSIIDFQIDAT